MQLERAAIQMCSSREVPVESQSLDDILYFFHATHFHVLPHSAICPAFRLASSLRVPESWYRTKYAWIRKKLGRATCTAAHCRYYTLCVYTYTHVHAFILYLKYSRNRCTQLPSLRAILLHLEHKKGISWHLHGQDRYRWPAARVEVQLAFHFSTENEMRRRLSTEDFCPLNLHNCQIIFLVTCQKHCIHWQFRFYLVGGLSGWQSLPVRRSHSRVSVSDGPCAIRMIHRDHLFSLWMYKPRVSRPQNKIMKQPFSEIRATPLTVLSALEVVCTS